MVKVTAGSGLISGHAKRISGNIQLTGPAMIDANVDYEFNGMVNQFTGFLPTNPPFTIRNLTICNTGSHNVTLNTDVTASGNLEIAEGSKFTVDVPYALTVETDVVVH